jgi:DNA-directed RNA polymerase beta' subunit
MRRSTTQETGAASRAGRSNVDLLIFSRIFYRSYNETTTEEKIMDKNTKLATLALVGIGGFTIVVVKNRRLVKQLKQAVNVLDQAVEIFDQLYQEKVDEAFEDIVENFDE